jgi:hypothetical protein
LRREQPFCLVIEEISGMFPAQYKANVDEPVPVTGVIRLTKGDTS